MDNQVQISILTPSIRPDLMLIVEKCLKRQDFEGKYEWLVSTSEERYEEMATNIKPDKLLIDPPKREGDFWRLCGAWNNLYAHAQGELIVNIQDGLWFPPDTLSKFFFHYQQNPRALVSAIGHQYEGFDELGKPLNKVWHDPRSKTNLSFEEVPPSEMEMCMCSIPKQALTECGGIDEIYDTCNGAQEKEMCWRLNKMNWDFYIDHTIEYRAIHHPRLTGDWDKIYIEKTTPIFTKHMMDLTAGLRELNVGELFKYASGSSIIKESKIVSHGA